MTTGLDTVERKEQNIFVVVAEMEDTTCCSLTTSVLEPIERHAQPSFFVPATI